MYRPSTHSRSLRDIVRLSISTTELTFRHTTDVTYALASTHDSFTTY